MSDLSELNTNDSNSASSSSIPSQSSLNTPISSTSNIVTDPNVEKSDKFKLLCSCIKLIERRYNGKRSRLNLQGFCDNIL